MDQRELGRIRTEKCGGGVERLEADNPGRAAAAGQKVHAGRPEHRGHVLQPDRHASLQDSEHVHTSRGVRGEGDAGVHSRDPEEDAGEGRLQSGQGTPKPTDELQDDILRTIPLQPLTNTTGGGRAPGDIGARGRTHQNIIFRHTNKVEFEPQRFV